MYIIKYRPFVSMNYRALFLKNTLENDTILQNRVSDLCRSDTKNRETTCGKLVILFSENH